MNHKKKVVYKRSKYMWIMKHPLFAVFLGVIGGIILSFVASFIITHATTMKQLPETNKYVMKKIPADVKKAMNEQKVTKTNAVVSQQASISATIRVPILMYHYVEYIADKKDTIRKSLTIAPAVFYEQVVTLKNARYTFLTAKDLGEILDG